MRTSRASGFSLVELVTVLVLVSLVCALAWPAMDRMVARARAASALNRFTGDLYYARMLAVKSGQTVVVRFDPSPRCPAAAGQMLSAAGYRIVVKTQPEREAKRTVLGGEGPPLCLQSNGGDSIAFNARGLLHGFMNRTVHARYRQVHDSLTISVAGRVFRRF
jgi:prepilin-type N-terminal cleavage/methylation domain-containing protein